MVTNDKKKPTLCLLDHRYLMKKAFMRLYRLQPVAEFLTWMYQSAKEEPEKFLPVLIDIYKIEH